MQELIESLNNLNESDFFGRINLHIHTTCSDGIMDPLQVLEKAQKLNLKIISITDHNSVQAYSNLPIEKLKDIQVIPGVEFDCWYKSNFIHMLGYGIDVNNSKILNLCAKTSNATKLDLVRFFNHRKAGDVIEAIKDAGGCAVLAHPACCWNINIKKMIRELVELGLDGLEVYYPYVRHRGIVKFHTTKGIINIARELNLIMTGGTDCHSENL